MKDLSKGDEDIRRWNIIDISKARDARYIPQLVARLESDETYENKRHIVRALGNIGDSSVGEVLLSKLQTEQGLIVGEIAEALGKLNISYAYEELQNFTNHSTPLISEKASGAIKKIKNGWRKK